MPIDTNSHLDEYSQFNQHHHDNLDNEVHSHTHKHSDDGQEHEHDHEHFKLVQNDFKILNISNKTLITLSEAEISNGFRVKNLVSSPHPFEILRPPIS